MTRAERRAQFVAFFRQRVDCIVEMQPPPAFAGRVDFDTFKLLLVCAHLEALAKARYSPRDSYGKKPTDSGRRFRRFLEEQSGLKHVYSLVALPRAQHLFRTAARRGHGEGSVERRRCRGDGEARCRRCELRRGGAREPRDESRP